MKAAHAVAVAALCLALSAAAQETPKPATPEVRIAEITRTKNTVVVTGATDLPDDTILSVFLVEEPEFIAHAREVRIITKVESKPVLDTRVQVSGKKFKVKFDLKRLGYYRVTLVYNRNAQILPEVVAALDKLTNTSWPEEFMVVDPDELPRSLKDQAPDIEGLIEEAERLEQNIEKRMENPEDWKEHGREVLKAVAPLVQEVRQFAATTVYNACTDTLMQALVKMNNFDPAVVKPNFKPGSAEEAMVLNMTEDIPGELSDAYLQKQIKAFLARARLAVIKERLVMPLRVVRSEWDNFIARLRNPKTKEKEIEPVRTKFQAAADGCTLNLTLIRDDKATLKKAGDDTLKAIAKALTSMTDLAKELEQTRGSGDFEDIDGRIKELRRVVGDLDSALRLIPKK